MAKIALVVTTWTLEDPTGEPYITNPVRTAAENAAVTLRANYVYPPASVNGTPELLGGNPIMAVLVADGDTKVDNVIALSGVIHIPLIGFVNTTLGEYTTQQKRNVRDALVSAGMPLSMVKTLARQSKTNAGFVTRILRKIDPEWTFPTSYQGQVAGIPFA